MGTLLGTDGPHAVHVQPVNDASSMLCCAGNSIPAPPLPTVTEDEQPDDHL